MPRLHGRIRSLSPARQFITDLARLAHGVPTVPIQRRMNLADVIPARASAVPRPGWCTLFTKAFAIVAARHPEFRQAYLTYPWPRLYEHPISVASVAIERAIDDEQAVLFTQIRGPDQQSLTDLDAYLRRCKQGDIHSIGSFRRLLKVSRLPAPLRRLVWWIGYHSSGARRAHHLGTFGVSVISGYGAEALRLISPLTTALDYGIIDEQGWVDVRLTIDHRVLDGAVTARALKELEDVLKTDILTELEGMRTPRREEEPQSALFRMRHKQGFPLGADLARERTEQRPSA